MANTSCKSVTFDPNVTGFEILSIYDFTPEEISAMWYDDEEMDRITNRCFKILQKMEAGKDKKYCIRGLEGHSSVGSISKKNNRSAAMAAVLTEQAEQWAEDRFDDQAIADAYQRTTSSCHMWAQVVGKRDQESAEAIHYQNENHEVILDAPATGYSRISIERDHPSPEQQRMKKVTRSGAFQQHIRAVAA